MRVKKDEELRVRLGYNAELQVVRSHSRGVYLLILSKGGPIGEHKTVALQSDQSNAIARFMSVRIPVGDPPSANEGVPDLLLEEITEVNTVKKPSDR